MISRRKHHNEAVGSLLQKRGFLKYLIDYTVLRKAQFQVVGRLVGWFVG